ncbi:MAG: NAD(P)-dependent oxidoreductase [Myxococcales bacterium]|nr:NAD(P)-dependent oxidoreductase [Myxococcales bacterium]
MRLAAVTGAGGFIGSALVRRLVREGVSVRALLGPVGAKSHPVPSNVEAMEGEIDRIEIVAQLVAGCEVVFHVAGPASVVASLDVPTEFARIHVAGTATALEASRRAGVARFVHVSSAEVYGVPENNPVHESHRLQARSPYAAAKIGAERMVESFRFAHGLEATILRPFSVYGPRQSAGGVVARVVQQVLTANAIELADLTPRRDFCFVDDVVEAMVLAADRRVALDDPILNVASGVGVTIGELARAAAAAANRDLPVRANRAEGPPRRADVHELVADTSRIRAALGWTPRTALVDGLRRTIEWFRNSEDA